MKPEALAGAWFELREWAHENRPKPESELLRRLREDLGTDPATLAVVSASLSDYDHVNLQVALDGSAASRR